VAPYKSICSLDVMGTGKLSVNLATPSVIWRGTVPLDLRVPAICGYLQNALHSALG